MLYSDDVIEEVRYGNDIVDVVSSYNISLKQRGGNFLGLCPFHNEKTPSFSVSSDKQMYKCFGCGEGGNVYSFVMKMDNVEFKEALNMLANRINYKLSQTDNLHRQRKAGNDNKDRCFEINKLSARFFYDTLMSEAGEIARKYLDNRKISKNTIVKYGLGYSGNSGELYTYLTDLGYDPNELVSLGLIVKSKNEEKYFDRFYNRLIFPILDGRGNVTGFGGRIIGSGEPKYLNSKETPVFDKSKNLYGINIARRNRNRELILVEGYMDVVALYQGGIENVVASLGTSFNQNHVRVLKRYCDSVILAFDSDQAGITAALKAMPIIAQNGLRVKVFSTNEAKDPDDYIKKFGKDKLKEQFSNAKSGITFQIECLLKKYDIKKPDESVMFTTDAVKILSEIDSSIEQDVYLRQVVDLTGISDFAIRTELAKTGKTLSPPVKPRRIKPPTEVLMSASKPNKAVTEAYKRLIMIMAYEPQVRNEVSKYLSIDEIHVDIYRDIFSNIFELCFKNEQIYPAEFLNRFETPEDQKVVANIFLSNDDIYISTTEKEVNGLVKKIKDYHINQYMVGANDDESLKNLENMRKTFVDLYIKISDG
ncbi:MAG: DNA primase [Defluviitaleaceae bacterium]|nr:DNA primase [Defluviitaleaceae bacterium]